MSKPAGPLARKKKNPVRSVANAQQRARHYPIVKQQLKDATYIVFDIETTGGNPERNGITEIYGIRYRKGEVLDTFHSMINPRIPIPPIVRRMTGITNQMVRNQPLIEEVMPKFLEFIGDDILVSHNTIGDLRFVVHFARKACGVEPHNYFLCTHLLTEKLIGEAPDKSLKGLAGYLKLPTESFHRAEVDARITLSLHEELLRRLDNEGIFLVEDAIRLQGDLESGLRLGWGLNEDILKGLPDSPGVFFLYDKQDRPIFLSSVLNLKQDISRLKSYQILPKNLLKIVLQTYRIDTKSHPNIFEAMLMEGESLIRRKLRFDPSQWHLRSAQVISLSLEGDNLRLALGQLGEGVKHAFGLIHDRKAAQGLIERLAEVFEVHSSRKGITLSLDRENILLAFFNGTLGDELKNVRSRLFSLRNIFNLKERQRLQRLYSEIKSLVAVEPLTGIKHLFNHSGVVVGNGPTRGQWFLYPIIDSVPFEPTMVEGDWRQWLRQSPKGKTFLEAMQNSRDKRAYQPISLKDSARMNAAIWVMFGNREKKLQSMGCAFFDLDELQKILNVSDSGELVS